LEIFLGIYHMFLLSIFNLCSFLKFNSLFFIFFNLTGWRWRSFLMMLTFGCIRKKVIVSHGLLIFMPYDKSPIIINIIKEPVLFLEAMFGYLLLIGEEWGGTKCSGWIKKDWFYPIIPNLKGEKRGIGWNGIHSIGLHSTPFHQSEYSLKLLVLDTFLEH